MLNFHKKNQIIGNNFKLKHQVLEDMEKNTTREFAACTAEKHTFKASNVWLESLRKSHNISLELMSRKRGDVNLRTVTAGKKIK